MKAKAELLMDRAEPIVLHHPVVVIDALAKNRSELTSALRPSSPAGSHASIEAFDEASEPGEATILAIGPGTARVEHLDQIDRLLRARPEVRAIMVVERLAPELLQAAMRVGISDVVARADARNELLDAALRADQALAVGGTGTGPVADDASGRVGRVTTVFSPKGGAGKSVVATNLAVALAKKATGPVVLLDADLQFGDDAVMLHMHPRTTLSDVVESMDRLDLHLLRSMLAVHEPSGVLLLASPLEPAMADRVTASHLSVIVNLLRSFAAHVVIDTPSSFDDIVIGLLDRSDDIILVGGMDIPTIKNLKVGLQTMGMLEIPANRVHLVLNRANTKVKVEVQEVERTLQLRAASLIPSDILVPTSVNRGIPAVLEAPRSGVARSFLQLADLVLAQARR